MTTSLRGRVCGTLLCACLAGSVEAQQLPDVAGIRLGVPGREGFAVLQAKYPKVKLDTYPLQLPTIDKPILIGFSFGFSPVQSTDERIAVHVTPPPEKQAVGKVQRFVGKQKIFRANVIASLREKYGKESAGASNGTLVSNVDKDAAEMWWIFENEIEDSGWCNTAMIAVVAYIGGDDIVTAFGVQAIDMPLALRAARAEVAWLKDLASKQQQQQQQIDESKQAKPKL